ncbi:MAG TPA: CoA transferase [Pseudonocardiaceae bacterium]|nr:CoA transferase [Pseudonocardiaceae bacterium]
MTSPLAGLRVLEHGTGVAVAYAGRLLRDCGAEVLKVSPAEGVERSLFAYLDGGKRPVLADRPDAEVLGELLSSCDVLVTSLTAPEWDRLGTTPAALAGEHAVVVDVTTFGLSGPYRDWVGEPELMASHLSGQSYGTPNGVADLDATPPRPSGGLDAELVGGVFAAITALAGRLLAAQDGRSHVGEVAMVDVLFAFNRLNVAQFTYAGVIPSRSAQGLMLRAPTGFLACADGYVNIHCANDAQWQRLVSVMGDPDWAANDLFATGESRAMFWDALKPLMSTWFAERSKHEVTALLQAQRIVCFPEQTMADLLADEQLLARHWFREIPGPIPVPGPAFRLPGMTTELTAAEPTDVPAALVRGDARPFGPLTGRAVPGSGPLSGIRVIDLSTVIGGPLATQILGQLGADVVKIESRAHPDLTRTSGPYPVGHGGPDASGYYHGLNAAKRSIVLEIGTPRGRALLEGLLANGDVLIENYSGSAAAKLGMSAGDLLARHPHLVYLSQSGLGRTGPHRDYVTYGPQLMARAGWNTVLGATEDDGTPLSGGGQFTDQLSGAHEVLAVIAALVQRERDGHGQYVDVSMLECQVPTVARQLVRRGGTGTTPDGVHGTFRCAGDDRWLGVSGDEDRLAVLLPGDGDVLDRLREWLRDRTPDEAMVRLQAAGIGAARVSNAEDVASDPHLAARRCFTEHDSVGYGKLRLPDLPLLLDGVRAVNPGFAPDLGEHTGEVLSEVLGLSDAEIAELRAEGVVS